MSLQFEWDPNKDESNLAKHGISFDEASTAFQDTKSVTITDPLHSKDEERYVLLGYSHRTKLLVVVHTDRGDRVRLISARVATKREGLRYEQKV